MRGLVALLIRLFPADFRAAFGADLLATFDDRWRDRRGCRLAARIVFDLARSAALERAAGWRRTQSVHPRGDRLMLTLFHDLRFALRTILRAPAFAALIVAVLALGIGANSAIFSLVDAVLLKPLPFARPAELVMLWEHPPGFAHNSVAPLNYLDWSEQNHVFSSLAAVSGGSQTLRTGNGAERIPGQSVTFSLFDLLGIRPIAGRTFTSDDVRTNANAVILSERLWKSHFGGSPSLIGQTIQLSGAPYTVIGIVPSSFQILYRSDLWTLYDPSHRAEGRAAHYLVVMGRLKPAVSIAQAAADMAVIAAGIARLSPQTNKDWGVTIEPLHDALIGSSVRTTSAVLAGVVGLVLLIACANAANLLLARAVSRGREFALRASLGGSHARILRQLLTESVLLASCGGLAGLILASLLLAAAYRFLPPGLLPVELHPSLDGRVIGFAGFLTLATSLLFGLAPAWHASRVSLTDTLREGSRSVAAGMGAFRSALAACQIAVAVLLVTGAGLLLRTMISLGGADPGFHAPNVLTTYITLPPSRYPDPGKALAFYRAAEAGLARVPGVRQVALGGSLPLDGWNIGQSFSVAAEASPDPANWPAAHYQIVSPHYFDVLGIRLLQGRSFAESDTGGAPPVCIVNEELVRQYLRGRNPIGASLRVEAMTMQGPKPVDREIVGVIRQVKVEGLGERQNNPEIYVPIAQNAWFTASIALQTAGDPLLLTSAVRAAIASIDKDLAVTRVRTMEEVAAASIAEPRFRAQLVGAFAALAMLLASIGIFGVLAFSVGRRTREFGIRMAVGARRGDILSLVLKSGLKMTAAGISVGLLAALLLTRVLHSLLYGVTPVDPFTFLATLLLLSAVALLACLAPALRASRVDPGIALHHD